MPKMGSLCPRALDRASGDGQDSLQRQRHTGYSDYDVLAMHPTKERAHELLHGTRILLETRGRMEVHGGWVAVMTEAVAGSFTWRRLPSEGELPPSVEEGQGRHRGALAMRNRRGVRGGGSGSEGGGFG